MSQNTANGLQYYSVGGSGVNSPPIQPAKEYATTNATPRKEALLHPGQAPVYNGSSLSMQQASTMASALPTNDHMSSQLRQNYNTANFLTSPVNVSEPRSAVKQRKRQSSSCHRGYSSEDHDSKERAFIYPCQAFKQFFMTLKDGKINLNDLEKSPIIQQMMGRGESRSRSGSRGGMSGSAGGGFKNRLREFQPNQLFTMSKEDQQASVNRLSQRTPSKRSTSRGSGGGFESVKPFSTGYSRSPHRQQRGADSGTNYNRPPVSDRPNSNKAVAPSIPNQYGPTSQIPPTSSYQQPSGLQSQRVKEPIKGSNLLSGRSPNVQAMPNSGYSERPSLSDYIRNNIASPAMNGLKSPNPTPASNLSGYRKNSNESGINPSAANIPVPGTSFQDKTPMKTNNPSYVVKSGSTKKGDPTDVRGSERKVPQPYRQSPSVKGLPQSAKPTTSKIGQTQQKSGYQRPSQIQNNGNSYESINYPKGPHYSIKLQNQLLICYVPH